MTRSILRKRPKSGFTVVSNDVIEDARLSYRARGVALLLLSRPDDWEISLPWLMKMGVEGRDAIRKCLHELATYGYLMRVREKDESGALRTLTLLADYPAFSDHGTPENRINGYDISGLTEIQEVPDLLNSGRSEDWTVRKPEGPESSRSLPNPDLPIPDLPSTDGPTTYLGGDGSSSGVGLGAPSAEKPNQDGLGGGYSADAYLMTLEGLRDDIQPIAARLRDHAERPLARTEYDFFFSATDPEKLSTVVDGVIREWDSFDYREQSVAKILAYRMRNYRAARGGKTRNSNACNEQSLKDRYGAEAVEKSIKATT